VLGVDERWRGPTVTLRPRRQCRWEIVLSNKRQLARGDAATLEDAKREAEDAAVIAVCSVPNRQCQVRWPKCGSCPFFESISWRGRLDEVDEALLPCYNLMALRMSSSRASSKQPQKAA
jgi:hypothetical protein